MICLLTPKLRLCILSFSKTRNRGDRVESYIWVCEYAHLSASPAQPKIHNKNFQVISLSILTVFKAVGRDAISASKKNNQKHRPNRKQVMTECCCLHQAHGVVYQVRRQKIRCPYRIFELQTVASTPPWSEDCKKGYQERCQKDI